MISLLYLFVLCQICPLCKHSALESLLLLSEGKKKSPYTVGMKKLKRIQLKKDCQKNICFPWKILQVTTRNDATLPIATRRLCGSPRSAPSWCFPCEVALGQAEEAGGSPTFGFCVAHNSGADGRSLPRMRRVRRL